MIEAVIHNGPTKFSLQFWDSGVLEDPNAVIARETRHQRYERLTVKLAVR